MYSRSSEIWLLCLEVFRSRSCRILMLSLWKVLRWWLHGDASYPAAWQSQVGMKVLLQSKDGSRNGHMCKLGKWCRVCYQGGHKYFTKEKHSWKEPAESVPPWSFLTLLSCTKQYTVDWARVLVWFKRKQWWKGCFEHRLIPDHIHLILSVHVSYLNRHHHWQILMKQCFEIFSMGFSFWFCGCAAAGYSWLQVCSAIQFASKCETAANLVPELAAGIQQCMDH